MSNKIIVNLTPTVQPDVIGDIEKGNGQSITSSSKLQVHIGALVKGATPQLVIDGKVVNATLKKAAVGYTLTTVNKLSDGSHTVAYKYKSMSGQAGEMSEQLTVTVDTLAPKAPTLAPVVYENANGGINAAKAADGIVVNVSLKGTDAQEGDTLNVMLGGVPTRYTLKLLDILYGANVTVPKSVIDMVGQGSLPVTASLTDAAKNTGPQSPATTITINTRVPNAPSSLIISNASDGYLNAEELNKGIDVDFSLKGTNAVAGDSVTVFVGENTTRYVLSSKDIANKNTHINLPKSVFEAIGQNPVDVSAMITNSANNESPKTNPLSLLVDTLAPNAPLYAPSVPENDKGGVNIQEAADGIKVGVMLSGTNAVAGDTIKLFLNSFVTSYTILAKDIAAKQAVISVPKAILDKLGPSSVNVNATIMDMAGNTSPLSATNGITLHTKPLNAPIVSTDVGKTVVDAQKASNGVAVHIALKGTNAMAGDGVDVTVNGISTHYTLTAQDVAKKIADVNIPQFALNAASDGLASVNATITDIAGNVSKVSNTTTFSLSNTVPTFIENGAPVNVFVNRTGLEKAIDTMLQEVKISIYDKINDGSDRLTFTPSSKIQGSFDASRGVLVLTPVKDRLVPKSEFESVLKTVKYVSTSENPTLLNDLADGSQPKDTRTLFIDIKETIITRVHDEMTVNVVGVEDLPSISLGSDANFLVSADLPTDPNVVYNPDKLPYVDSGMVITDLDDPNAFGGLIRIANWNWKTDAFTLDMKDTQGIIKPVLFDVRTAQTADEAVNQINDIIRNSMGNGQYGFTYDGLVVGDKVRYIAQGENYGDGFLPDKGALVNVENKATLGFLQIPLGYIIAVYPDDPNVYPYTVPVSGFSQRSDVANTGIFNTLRIASNEANVDRPVEFVITGAKKGATPLSQEEAMKMTVNDVLNYLSGSTS
ncbi:MAG TPA: hypothetical protein DF614_05670, partial [Methylococcaceae bacterium]|nr:hypothetical protein [Methylococcaceae bacterium]